MVIISKVALAVFAGSIATTDAKSVLPLTRHLLHSARKEHVGSSSRSGKYAPLSLSEGFSLDEQYRLHGLTLNLEDLVLLEDAHRSGHASAADSDGHHRENSADQQVDNSRDSSSSSSSSSNSSSSSSSSSSSTSLSIVAKLSSESQVFYTLPVEVGTPPVPVQLAVDTGSADTWASNMAYSPERSKTSRKTKDDKFTVTYGMGSISGHEVLDRLCIGDDVCTPDLGILSVTESSGIPPLGTFYDGLFGLALPPTSELGPTGEKHTFGSELLHTRDSLKFGLCLRNFNSSSESLFIVGEMEEVLEEGRNCTQGGPGVTIPVQAFAGAYKYWMVLTDVTVGQVEALQKVPAYALLDSGTTFLGVPITLIVQLVVGILPESSRPLCGSFMGALACRCDANVNELSFSFKGSDTLLEVRLMQEDLLTNRVRAKQMNTGEYLDICRLAVQPVSLGGSQPFILGDTFLRHTYLVHDLKNMEVTIFPQPEDRSSVSSFNAFLQNDDQPLNELFLAASLFAGLAVLACLAAGPLATLCLEAAEAREVLLDGCGVAGARGSSEDPESQVPYIQVSE